MRLILIDGYGFVFRAFHSLPPLTKADGTPIGAVYGFTNMLMKIVNQYPHDAIAVMVDCGKPTFRHELFTEYKANRPAPPQDLILQFPFIRKAVEAFGIQCIEKEGFEADDLIATYAVEAKNKGIDVIIVSSDKDLMQLTQYGIQMYDAMKDKYIEESDVFNKFNVAPDKIREVQSLIGDASDNIPGVKGIGVKTAAELINQFGSLQNLYDHLDEIPQVKRKQMLIDGKENAFLSYKLVELALDAPVEYNIDDLLIPGIDSQKLMKFFQEHNFKALLSRLQSSQAKSEVSNVTFTELTTADALTKYLPEIYKVGIVYIYHDVKEFSLSFAAHNLKFALTTGVAQANLFDESASHNILQNILDILQPIFIADSVKKITLNAKQLYKISDAFSCFHDVATIIYAIETGRAHYTFEGLINEYSISYQNQDSHAIQLIYEHLYHRLVLEKCITLYERIDYKINQAIAIMENNGVLLDVLYLNSLTTQFSLKLTELESKILNLCDSTFNLASPKQLGEILFDKLKLPAPKKSKTGNYSTSAEVLEDLQAAGHNIAGFILEWRQFSKLISTYTNALPKCINSKTGRVHSTFSLTSTSTGRFSSIDPNLQNIPIRTEEGQKIRKAFIARKGYKIISADYSQIELRLLAHYANIPTLKNAFQRGEDIHALTASEIFNVPINEVDSNLRRQAKMINFGIIYGISAFGLAKRLGIDNGKAKKFIEHYFVQYPGIKEYMNGMIEFAKTHGFIKTIFGRKCLLTGINDPNFNVRSFAERAAINAPLQASAADIIKKAMVDLPPYLQQYLILQIHDELLFEVPEDLVTSYSEIIKSTMEKVIALSVPLTVEVHSGDNWDEAH